MLEIRRIIFYCDIKILCVFMVSDIDGIFKFCLCCIRLLGILDIVCRLEIWILLLIELFICIVKIYS